MEYVNSFILGSIWMFAFLIYRDVRAILDTLRNRR